MNTNLIIKQCIQGDQKAFRQLVEHHADFTFRIAFRIVSDEDMAKDIMQETFISVWKNLQKFELTKNFEHWLYRILVNKCLDHLRKQKKYPAIYPATEEWDHFSAHTNTPEHQITNQELGNKIRSLTHELSPKQKVVFVLSELEMHSADEIAAITGLSKTSIKSNLNFARRNIAKLIKNFI